MFQAKIWRERTHAESRIEFKWIYQTRVLPSLTIMQECFLPHESTQKSEKQGSKRSTNTFCKVDRRSITAAEEEEEANVFRTRAKQVS